MNLSRRGEYSCVAGDTHDALSDSLLRHTLSDSFLSVVTRVLNDDGKRSLDLSLSIFSIFYCISNFPDYHDQLTGNKAGDSCFRAIEREITRFQVWCDDARRRDTGVPLSAVPSGSGKAGDDSRKLLSMARKQDRVLMLAFSILTNLSFNLAVEVKMVKRGIVDLIAATFEIQSTRNKVLFSGVARSALVWGDELTIVLLDLLKKLSIFQENRSKLCENADDILNYLLRIIVQQNDQPMIVQTAVSVLCNLLHDPTMRIHVRAHQDLLPRVISLMQESHGDIHDGIVRMLYLVSCDALVNEELTHTEAIPAVGRVLCDCDMSKLIAFSTTRRCV